MKPVKSAKFFGIFNSYCREYIDNINCMYIFFQADTEEEGLSYYPLRQPGTINLIKDFNSISN